MKNKILVIFSKKKKGVIIYQLLKICDVKTAI